MKYKAMHTSLPLVTKYLDQKCTFGGVPMKYIATVRSYAILKPAKELPIGPYRLYSAGLVFILPSVKQLTTVNTVAGNHGLHLKVSIQREHLEWGGGGTNKRTLALRGTRWSSPGHRRERGSRRRTLCSRRWAWRGPGRSPGLSSSDHCL